MITPEIRRLQVLNDLIAQTLDVINQRSLWSGGLSHTPYAPEFGVPQVNPYMAQYGVPQPNIGQLAGAQVPFAAQGLMHSPFAGLGQQGPGFGLGFGQQGVGVQGLPFGQQGLPFGQQPFGQFQQLTPYASPWTQGLMHTPFAGYPVQRGIEAGIGIGQPGLGFGQQPFGQGQQPFGQGVVPGVPFASPWSSIGFGASRYGVPYGGQSF